jgi:hypothetical protein
MMDSAHSDPHDFIASVLRSRARQMTGRLTGWPIDGRRRFGDQDVRRS